MNGKNIKFSILVPAFKARFLAECIDSILSQTYTNFELIIVNDASPENLGEIVSSYNDSRIQYYVNEKNCGAVNVVDNWNKCLSYANGDYVICMGDDDKLLPCCLEEYRKLIERYPEIGILHAFTEIINEKNEFIRYQYKRPERESVYEMIYSRWEFRKDQFIGDFCFKHSVLKNHGGFYKLPLAWGSDDISAYIAAENNGVANTQIPCFQYRINTINITSTGNVHIKINAISQERDWYAKFLSNKPKDTVDLHLWTLLLNKLNKHINNKIEILIAQDIYAKGFYRIIYWLKRTRQLNLSNKTILRSLGRSFLIGLRQL